MKSQYKLEKQFRFLLFQNCFECVKKARQRKEFNDENAAENSQQDVHYEFRLRKMEKYFEESERGLFFDRQK